MPEEISAKWNVIISSLQDICQMDSLDPMESDSLQESQKHKENIDKATRLIAPLLENVNLLLSKNTNSGNSSNNTSFASAVNGVSNNIEGSTAHSKNGSVESGSPNANEKPEMTMPVSATSTGSQQSSVVTASVAGDDLSTPPTSSINNTKVTEHPTDISHYDSDTNTSKAQKHSPQDTPGRAGRNRRSGQHQNSSAKASPELKKGKSYFSSQYNPSEPIFVGSEVAFKLRYGEWIQCVVTKIIDSTKFEVTDPEPDENNNPGKTYKTNWKEVSLVPPVKFGKLQNYPVGTKVIARYPETTTFYPAEVIGTKRDGKCRLRFDGEEEVGKETEVERRLVLPYPSR